MPITDPKHRQRRAKYKWSSSKKPILPEDYRSCTSINCSSYGAQMPTWFFSKDSRRRDGISTLCKECRAWASRRTRDKHRYGDVVRQYKMTGPRVKVYSLAKKASSWKVCRIHRIPPYDCQCPASGFVRGPGHAGGLSRAHRDRISKGMHGKRNRAGKPGRKKGIQHSVGHRIGIAQSMRSFWAKKRLTQKLVEILIEFVKIRMAANHENSK